MNPIPFDENGEYTVIIFNNTTVTKAQLEGHQRTLAYWKQRRFPKPPPTPAPDTSTVVFREDWRSLDAWGVGNNGDAGQNLVPSGVELWIKNARSIAHGTGSRLFHLVPPSKQWVSLPDGVNTIRYPLTIPELFSVDQGADKFMGMGIQFKDQTANNALWVINVETVNGQLVPWIWHREAGVFHNSRVSPYAIGTINDCTLKVNVAPDNTGSIEFSLGAGEPIVVENVRTRGSDTDDNGWGAVLYSNAVDSARVIMGELTVSRTA